MRQLWTPTDTIFFGYFAVVLVVSVVSPASGLALAALGLLLTTPSA